jgi:hypothetical protein
VLEGLFGELGHVEDYKMRATALSRITRRDELLEVNLLSHFVLFLSTSCF